MSIFNKNFIDSVGDGIPEFPKDITVQEKYDGAIKIITEEDADKYFVGCVLHTRKYSGVSVEQAIIIEKNNIGYYAGYYDRNTRIRVEDLYDTQHPIFGKASKSIPTPEEAYLLGIKAATGGTTPHTFKKNDLKNAKSLIKKWYKGND